MKGKGGAALKDCSLVVAGDAAGILLQTQYPKVMGFNSSTLLGFGAIAFGAMRNRPEPIYIGFGALYPAIHGQLMGLIAGK